MSLTVGLYLFDDVEVLDFAGPFEVFSTASRVHARLYPGAPEPFRVMTVGPGVQTVVARGGLRVAPDYAIGAHPPLDVLIIPGGVVTAQLGDQRVIDWIAAHAARDSAITASVCTGAFLLSKAGVLQGKPATTHWEDIADLRAMFPGVKVQDNQRWVDVGQVITSAGISAGIDMSLHLVSRLTTRELAVRTARQMEYDWQDANV